MAKLENVGRVYTELANKENGTSRESQTREHFTENRERIIGLDSK
jgi:hypothetical protein